MSGRLDFPGFFVLQERRIEGRKVLASSGASRRRTALSLRFWARKRRLKPIKGVKKVTNYIYISELVWSDPKLDKEWIEYNYRMLVRHNLICTGMTGRLVEETIADLEGKEGIIETVHASEAIQYRMMAKFR
jgi:predicted ATPase with chaperone activity